MASTVQSLFGDMFKTPAQMVEEQQQKLIAQGNQAAGMMLGSAPKSGLAQAIAGHAAGIAQQMPLTQETMRRASLGAMGMAAGAAGNQDLQSLYQNAAMTPQERAASEAQSIARGIDPTKPESYVEAAKKLQAMGLSGAAAQALQQGNALKAQSRADITWQQGQEDRVANIARAATLDQRETWLFQQKKDQADRDAQSRTIGQKAMEMMPNFDPQSPDLIGLYGNKIKLADEMGRSDLSEKYMKELADYKEKQMTRLNTSMGVISAKDYTAAGSAKLNQLRAEYATLPPNSPEALQKLREMQAAQTEFARKAAQENAQMAQAEAKAKTEGEEAVKLFYKSKEELKAEGETIADNLKFVTEMDDILRKVQKGEIFIGTGAEMKMDLVKMGQALGINEDEWTTKAANTEQAMTLLSAKILDKIKQLGANPSNADREFLAKTLPMVTTSPEGLKKIRDYMALRATQAHDTLKQKQEYLAKNRNLDNFESKATAEMAAFLKKEGIDSSKLNERSGAGVEFDKDQISAFKGGSAPFAVYKTSKFTDIDGKEYPSSDISIYAYPAYRIVPADIISQYDNGGTPDTAAMLRRATQLDNLIKAEEVGGKPISDEDKAQYYEELKALSNAMTMITTGKR